MAARPNTYRGGRCAGNANRIIVWETKLPFVQHLLRFHYLPHSPACVAMVAGALDVSTGTTVGCAIVAYPVLRCTLREQVFGLLSPQKLNADFRQLVRLIVHPDYRTDGLAERLLRLALATSNASVFEAINRSFVPDELFARVGMLKRSTDSRNYWFKVR